MKRIPAPCIGLLLSLLAGCGSGGIKIEGTVQFRGQPIDNGSISFEPAGGNGSEFGATITNGKYEVTCPAETPPGTLTVRIRAAIKTGKQVAAGSPTPPGTLVDEVISLPAIYNNQSTLTATLEAGKVNQVIDFDLK